MIWKDSTGKGVNKYSRFCKDTAVRYLNKYSGNDLQDFIKKDSTGICKYAKPKNLNRKSDKNLLISTPTRLHNDVHGYLYKRP